MLQDKVVIVTGAKGGLGSFVTQAFLEAGATVIGVSRSISKSDFPHSSFVAMPAELSSLDVVRRLVDAIVAGHQRVDAAVHLIGGFAGGQPVEDTDDATIDRMMEVNFRSALHLVRAVLPHMRRQTSGRIVAVGSRSAVEPSGGSAAYGASKAALVSLIRSVAAENARFGVGANVVLPGALDTAANRAADSSADFSQWVHPKQVAEVLLHLASESSSGVNGAVIPIYGQDV
jgi:NAD(P)-dependent dehydrogenase (short-subunit alcohol dehydrogenase family)